MIKGQGPLARMSLAGGLVLRARVRLCAVHDVCSSKKEDVVVVVLVTQIRMVSLLKDAGKGEGRAA